MNRVREFLERIRLLDGLKNAILCGIILSKRNQTAEFTLVTDRAYTPADEKSAREICGEFLPDGLTPLVKIIKRVPDEEMLKARIYEFIKKSFPAAGAFLDLEHIGVEMLTSGAHFFVDVAAGEQTLFSSGKILDEVSRYLTSIFCGTFYGNVRIVEKEAPSDELLKEMPEESEEGLAQELREFPICEYVKIDGADSSLKNAVYIEDCHLADGVFSVCGTLQYFEEIAYVRKNETTGEEQQRTRFSLSVNDGSGVLRTTYFPKKATVEKVRALKIGDKIVVTGSNEDYKGNRSFKAALRYVAKRFFHFYIVYPSS